jgi:hypothetical protein
MMVIRQLRLIRQLASMLDGVLAWVAVHVLDNPHDRFGRRWSIQPCGQCGHLRWVKVWYKYPKLDVGQRPVEEHVSAPTPSDWKPGEQSDNLSTRSTRVQQILSEPPDPRD